MKKLGAGRIAWIFAGSILGAGFVSGQELWQFFGEFGIWGGVGLILSMLILMLLGMVILRISQMTGSIEFDKVIMPRNSGVSGFIIGFVQILFLFGVVTIMIAGAGELMNQLTGAPGWVMCLIMTVTVMVISITGLEGVASVFSFCVPLIAVSSIVFAVIALFCFDGAAEGMESINENKLLPNWIAAAVTYASYNMFASLGVLCPFGKSIKDKKTLYKGVLLGTFILLLISGCILLALSKYTDAVNAGMPMLALASAVHPVLGYVYGLLLFCGLLGTSVSCIVAIDTYMCAKIKLISHNRVLFIALLGIASFAMSLFGFGNLISMVYPVFGYISSVFIVCMLVNFRRLSARNIQS